MRRSFLLGFALLILATLTFTILPQAAQASDLSYARIVRLSVVNGDVQISRPMHPAWEPAAENMPMMQGMTLGTNYGYAEVQFEDGTTAWIAPNTMVQFTELALADGGRITKLTLGQGTISILTQLRRGDNFSLATSEETITTPKNALFRVDAFHDGASVSVLLGNVDVASALGTKRVAKGQTLAYKSKLKDVSLRANPKPDNWDRWVVGRAQQTETEAAQSASYVNAPFSYGMADLSQYGAWNYFQGYGYGWQPMGMGNCWMPFMNGAWNFYSGFGWTWVSGEPWGWLPYHFGSWDYLPSTGWAWFPTSLDFWNPAPVNWYTTGNQVGWWPASSFGAPSGLMFEQIADGCPGSGYGLGGMQTMFAGRPGATGPGALKAVPPSKRFPTPPRLLLTTSRLGHNGAIRLFASEEQGKRMAFVAGEPLENGKASTMFSSAFANNRTMASRTRMFAPTVGSIARLRVSVAARSASMPTMRMNSRMPAMPMRESLRAVNAMPKAAALPHRPMPMAFSRGGMDANSGFYNRGAQATGMGGMPGTKMGAPAPAAMPMPSASARRTGAVAAGRPH